MGGGDHQAGRQGTRRSPLQRAAREAHRLSSRGAASSAAEKPKASRDVHPEHPGARRLACSSTPAAVSGEGADVMRQGWIGGGLWSGRRTCLTRSGHESAGSPNRPGFGIPLATDRSTSRRRDRHDQPRCPQSNREASLSLVLCPSAHVPPSGKRMKAGRGTPSPSAPPDTNRYSPLGQHLRLAAGTTASRLGRSHAPKPVPISRLATPPSPFQPVLLNITQRCFDW